MTADIVHIAIRDRAAMEAFAHQLALVLTRGDVMLLTGNLGAGKTTFTQFLGRALDVRGRVSSPTFTIAREHPARGAGPGLVHVDAYRLTSADEFDDLGLEASAEESVTVVEWGRGMAEALGDHLDIEITRTGALGAADAEVTGAESVPSAAQAPEAAPPPDAAQAPGAAPSEEIPGSGHPGDALEDALEGVLDDDGAWSEDEDEERIVVIRAVGRAWEDRRERLAHLALQ